MPVDVRDLPPEYQMQALRKLAEREKQKQRVPLPPPLPVRRSEGGSITTSQPSG